MYLSRISSLLRRPSKMTPQPAPRDRKGRIFRFLKKAALVCIGLGAVGIFCFTIFLAWVSRDLPNPDTLSTREVPQSTKIFDRTGKQLLYELHGDEKRTLAKIEDIPLTMQHATISIEDRSFYKHHGVYWKGLVRALGMSVLTQTRVKGTSTLTQQLVKNAILTDERSYVRKIKEAILSVNNQEQLEQHVPKKDIKEENYEFEGMVCYYD